MLTHGSVLCGSQIHNAYHASMNALWLFDPDITLYTYFIIKSISKNLAFKRGFGGACHIYAAIGVSLTLCANAVIFTPLVTATNLSASVAAFEILINNDACANNIRNEKIHQIEQVMASNVNMGMRTMNESLKRLTRDGIISKEQAFTYSPDKEELKKLV